MQNNPLDTRYPHGSLKIAPSAEERAQLYQYVRLLGASCSADTGWVVDHGSGWDLHPDAEVQAFDPNVYLFSSYDRVICKNLPTLCGNMHFCQFDRHTGLPYKKPFYNLSVMDPMEDHDAFLDRDMTEHPGTHDGFLEQQGDPIQLLKSIQLHCLSARLRPCESYRCSLIKNELDRLLPKCPEWESFRTWLLCAMSCELAANNAGNIWTSRYTMGSFEELLKISPRARIHNNEQWIAFRVFELLYFWRSEICDLDREERDFLKDTSEFRGWRGENGHFSQITAPSVSAALVCAEKLQICPKRLWNLARTSHRGPNDIPALLLAIDKSDNPRRFRHKKHYVCSPEHCPLENENSTRKPQIHVCEHKNCRVLKFPVREFDNMLLKHAKSLKKHPGAIVWPLKIPDSEKETMSPIFASENTYAAISHVWSDGTGVGIGNPGEVNSCIYRRFASKAAELGCNGIWWDAICVPENRELKRNAMNNMHLTYQYARHTIVHDKYLTKFPWTDDAAPGIALVLSPWFTRGWTALELAMSREVSVLYKHPSDGQGLVLKRLHGTIIPDGATSLEQRIVARLIQRIRDPRPSLFDLLKVLSCRVTSWAQDRSTITALMARTIEVKDDETVVDLAQKIILAQKYVPKALLFHGNTTLTRGGPFSWCPYNLFDSNFIVNSSVDEGTLMRDFYNQYNPQNGSQGIDEALRQFVETRPDHDELKVSADGTILGKWNFIVLGDNNVNLKPYSSHISVEFRISAALKTPWRYLVLHCDSFQPLGILVAPTGFQHDGAGYNIHCNYIGCVTGDVHSSGTPYVGNIKIGSGGAEVERGEHVISKLRRKTNGMVPEPDY